MASQERGAGHGEKDRKTGLERLITGIPRLDFITKGGLIKGSSYTVLGPPGSGKTVLANQMAFNHVSQGGRALYVTLLSESHAHAREPGGDDLLRPERHPRQDPLHQWLLRA